MEIYDQNKLYDAPSPPPEPPRKRGVFALSVAALAVALCALVCAVVALVLSCRGKSAGESESYEKAYEKARACTAEVRCGSLIGSGVVYALRGGVTYVLTNYHVVETGDVPDVRFVDKGERYEATLCGFDAYHDIAILSVAGSFGTPAVLGDAPAVGRRVLAVGNNLGYGTAAYDGIVSRTNRLLKVTETGKENKTVPVYAVTCPVNAGMSGGGVFTLDGKLVGIGTYQVLSVQDVAFVNSQIDTSSRPVDGVSYVVPATVADKIARRIMENPTGGQVDTIEVRGVADSTNAVRFTGLYFSATVSAAGWTVDLVDPVTPDLRGGVFRVGDVLTRIGTLSVTAQTDAALLFDECLCYAHDPSLAGEILEIEVMRGNERVTLSYEYKRRKYA